MMLAESVEELANVNIDPFIPHYQVVTAEYTNVVIMGYKILIDECE